MRTVEAQGHSIFTQQVAVLHDTVEDSDWTLDMLANEGFGDDVLIPLDLLTKHPGDIYEEYVTRLMPNPRARAVKKADLMDNMDLTGLENPSRARIETIEKYGRALVLLSRFPLPRI
jgi:(p)ppGpp synthase/HD superfamily hydrolase